MSDVHETSAAYVLGALSPAERKQFEAHLHTCERCQRDVLEFSPLPGLLSKAEPGDASVPIDVADDVIRRVGTDLEHTTTSRNRWRMATAAAVAAAAVLVGVLFVDTDDASFDQGPFSQSPVIDLAIDQSVGTPGVTGTMTVSERPWGSKVDIDLFDMPTRDRYLLWAVSSDGTWDVAASWAWAESGTCRVSGATRFQPSTIDHLVVTSADKADILVESS